MTEKETPKLEGRTIQYMDYETRLEEEYGEALKYLMKIHVIQELLAVNTRDDINDVEKHKWYAIIIDDLQDACSHINSALEYLVEKIENDAEEKHITYWMKKEQK